MHFLSDHCQIQPLLLSEFDRINELLFSLRPSENLSGEILMGGLFPVLETLPKICQKDWKKKKKKSMELNSESLKGFFLILHYFCLLKYNICIITLDCFQSSSNVKFCNPEDPTIHLLSVMNVP